MNKLKGEMAVISLIVAAMLLPAVSNAQWRTRWEYTGPKGPDHWTGLDPDYATCNVGKAQSPVAIDHAQKADLPALRFESQSRPLTGLQNNGYTIRVNYHEAPGKGDLMWVGNERYQLKQLHFHNPSEETINGKRYDMVAHFMYQTIDGKKQAGVAVLLKAGSASSALQQLWDHMPMTEDKINPDFSHAEHTIAGVNFDPAGFLPPNLGYYVYEGSVTAPPCTEPVVWYVLKTPMEISAAQIAAFTKLYANGIRPLQPLNGRIVKESN